MAQPKGPTEDPGAGGWRPLEWEGDDRSALSGRPKTERRSKRTAGGRFDRLFGGWFGRLLLPAVIAQSILIGGGYATGREVVEFGARFGALGWIAVLAVFVGFSVASVLVFEFARVSRVYDYKSFVKGLIGPAWPLFDVLYASMGVLTIAVIAAASGAIMRTTLGLPYVAGIMTIMVVVAVLLFFGSRLIEAFKTIGTTALYIGYAVFAVVVLSAGWPQVMEVLSSGDTQHAGVGAGVPSVLAVVGVGVLYVGYNLSIFPAVLFALHRQRAFSNCLVGGLAAGLIMTLPFLLTWLCVLAFYSDGQVVQADVPWLYMLDSTAGTWVVVLFGIVMGWTLMETSVGFIHAVLDRLDRDLVDLDLPGMPRGTGLSGLHKGVFGAFVLLLAALLAQVGIVRLVGDGYTWMAYGFLAIFAFPLVTVGVWKIVRSRRAAHERLLEDRRATTESGP